MAKLLLCERLAIVSSIQVFEQEVENTFRCNDKTETKKFLLPFAQKLNTLHGKLSMIPWAVPLSCERAHANFVATNDSTRGTLWTLSEP